MAEEVATALLDASRRMSMSSSSTDSRVGGGGWWDTSNSEGDDKTGSVPRQVGSWFPAAFGVGARNRTMSESSGSFSSRLDPWIPVSWITGSPGVSANNNSQASERDRKFSEPAIRADAIMRGRMRRNSSKDIEEAMAGGLNKADIYMPQV